MYTKLEKLVRMFLFTERNIGGVVPRQLSAMKKKSIKKTGWYLKSWRKEDIHWPLSETDEGILDYITRNSLSNVNYKMGKQFYIDGDMVIHAYPSIKFMLLGTDGGHGTRTLIYVYSFESEEEAMNAIERIKSVNPGLTLTYQEERTNI